jgi:hypothetical protein
MSATDKKRVEEAVRRLCRFQDRIAEWATHYPSEGNYEDGTLKLDFSPAVLTVCDEELPGEVSPSAVASAVIEYPDSAEALAGAIDAWENIKQIHEDAPPEYWQWAERTIPWTHEGTIMKKLEMDEQLSHLFRHTRALLPIYVTLE